MSFEFVLKQLKLDVGIKSMKHSYIITISYILFVILIWKLWFKTIPRNDSLLVRI